MKTDLLKSILDDEFLESLAKSADLYKIGSNSVLDPEEIRIGLKVVPRAVMSMLISELSPMPINSHKDIELPFGNHAKLSANKNAADDYTGSVYDGNKLVYDFKNRSIPGLGIILLSTFELYDMEELDKPSKNDEAGDKIQKLIDERMELHSLVGKVVEEKISQREALHRLMMDKLKTALEAKKEPEPIMPPVPAQVPHGSLDVKAKDIVKKEEVKRELPLKKFLDKRKNRREHHVEILKSESVGCPDCGQIIFGNSGYSGCICFGSDRDHKIWVRKSEEGVALKFSRGWDSENIKLFLDLLRNRK